MEEWKVKYIETNFDKEKAAYTGREKEINWKSLTLRERERERENMSV